MSRLGGVGSEGPKGRPQAGLPFSMSMIVTAGAIVFIVIVVILAFATVYSLVSSNAISLSSITGVIQATSSTTSSTSTTSTTTPPPPTTSTSSTSTTSTSSSVTVKTTETTEPTTTTFSKYQIAACMAGKTRAIYTNDFLPSGSLKIYLGSYINLFPIIDCTQPENKVDCQNELKAYMDNDELFFKNSPIKILGYPAVVVGDSAYIISGPAEFERLLECGSLKDG